MTDHVYKSAKGKMVDMARLATIHENMPAVGNANMNSRGDEIGPNGQIIRTREELLQDYYNQNPRNI